MTAIKIAAQRLLASVALTVASFFDRGVDSVIGEFAKLSTKLDIYIDRQAAIIDETARQATASFARVNEVKKVEEGFRATVYAREDNAFDNLSHAQRVRARIQKLID